MEKKSFFDEAGRLLTSNDIIHLDNTLLAPASGRCRRTNINNKYVFGKGSQEPALIHDGVKYYPYFSSGMNDEANTWEYRVGLGALEETTFDMLPNDQRQQIIQQFQEQYINEGGVLAEINDDDEWQALSKPEMHKNIGIQVSSMQQYVFADLEAERLFAVERTMSIGPSALTRRRLGRHSLYGGLEYWGPSKVGKLSPDEAAVLDLAAEDYCAVTTEDVHRVINILKMLDLISPNDEKRFDQGRR